MNSRYYVDKNGFLQVHADKPKKKVKRKTVKKQKREPYRYMW